MTKLCIHHSVLHDGEIAISGARHASNLLIAASVILMEKQITLRNVPQLKDTDVMCQLLEYLGMKFAWQSDHLLLNTETIINHDLPVDLTCQIHGSIYLIPAVLVRMGEVTFEGSGGCQIGAKALGCVRPEHHIFDVMKRFGAIISKDNEGIHSIICKEVIGCEINIMEYSLTQDNITGPLTSGATKTALLMAMAVKKGVTMIHHPFMKSEAIDLIEFMKMSGYEIDYHHNCLKITPKQSHDHHAIDYQCVSDPTEIMTYVALAVFHNITLKLTHITPRLFPILNPEFDTMKKMNISFSLAGNSLTIHPSEHLKKVQIEITPTGVCTDHHPFFVLMMLHQAGGRLIEHVWHERFNYVKELNKFGINIDCQGSQVDILPTRLKKKTSEVIDGHNLRATAMLIILAIASDSKSYFVNFAHIDRGYVNFLEKLTTLGMKYHFSS